LALFAQLCFTRFYWLNPRRWTLRAARLWWRESLKQVGFPDSAASEAREREPQVVLELRLERQPVGNDFDDF